MRLPRLPDIPPGTIDDFGHLSVQEQEMALSRVRETLATAPRNSLLVRYALDRLGAPTASEVRA